jgi:hypothetical protein
MKKLILLILLAPILFYSCLDENKFTEEKHVVTNTKDMPHNQFVSGIGNKSYMIYLNNGDSIKVKKSYNIGDTVIYRFYKVD